MSRLTDSFLSFTKEHPFVGGAVIVILGLFMTCRSIENAERYRLYDQAKETTGRVVSIEKGSLLPPRSEVTVSWSDGGMRRTDVMSLGPGSVEELQEGSAVRLLIGSDGSAILASKRQSDEPVRFAGIEAMPLVFFGLGIMGFGVIIALFGRRLL